MFFPLDIELLIHEYAQQMSDVESLPEIASISELAKKSNRILVAIANRKYNIPLPVLMEIHLRENFNEPLCIDFELTSECINNLNEIVLYSILRNWPTSSLFWLFIIREPNLYHGPYAQIFEDSLLFKLLNIIINV